MPELEQSEVITNALLEIFPYDVLSRICDTSTVDKFGKSMVAAWATCSEEER